MQGRKKTKRFKKIIRAYRRGLLNRLALTPKWSDMIKVKKLKGEHGFLKKISWLSFYSHFCLLTVIPHVILAKSLSTSIFQYTLISGLMCFISLHYSLNDIVKCVWRFHVQWKKVNPFRTASLLCWLTLLSVTTAQPCMLSEHLSPGLLSCQIYRSFCITFHPESAHYMT